MKNLKKIMALVIAMVMTLSTISAFAATGDFSQTPDETITVQGLESTDTVEYFQVLEVDTQNAPGWKLCSGVTGITVADILDGISAEEAAIIANCFTNGAGTAMTNTNGTATATVANPGLYFVSVTPGETVDYIYNPIFVSADYYEGGTNDITIDTSASYSDEVIAKKQPIPLTKTMDETKDKDVAPGDDVEFTVTTNVPSYTDKYTEKKFNLTDILSDGLELKTGTIVVTIAGKTAAQVAAACTITENKDPDGGDINGYSIVFDSDFLDEVVGNPLVTIKYTATVTDDAAQGNVTEMDNDVTLDYTHDFSGNDKEITKTTRHYTFGIDAKLLGESGTYSQENTEDLVKVGVDANGDPIIVSHTSSRTIDGGTSVAALDGAKFTLEAYSGDCTTSKKTSWEITTNSLGEISVTGLDAGIYKLTETSAPAGWIIDNTPHYVEIAPEYGTDADGNPYLLSYSIKWGDDPASLTPVKTYTMTNNDPDKKLTGIKTSHIQGSDTQIQNTQGVQLPSTGGMGTTLFYIIGAILVLGAGILLVTRRRMSAN